MINIWTGQKGLIRAWLDSRLCGNHVECYQASASVIACR